MRILLLVVLLLVPAWAQDRGQDMHDFFQWALDAPLTQRYSDKLQAVVATMSDASLQPLYNQIDNLNMTGTGARAELRTTYRAELLGLDGPLGDLARQINQDARQPMVQGNPPLTRLAVEAFSEWYLFALGQTGPPPGKTFNDSMAVTLQAIYPKLTPAQQQSLGNVASMWAALRQKWPTMSAADQATLKAQWATLLAPIVARRAPLAPAFQALEALRQAAKGDDPSATAAAEQAVTAQSIRLQGLGTPEAMALAKRLDEVVSGTNTLSQLNAMSSEIADRAHLPISDPDSIQPIVNGTWQQGWAGGMSPFMYRW